MKTQFYKTIFCFSLLFISGICSIPAAASAPDSTKVVTDTKETPVYHVNKYVQGAIILAGMASDYPAIGRIKNKADITDAEIGALAPNQINLFDRWAVQMANPLSSKVTMYNNISNYGQIPIFMLPGFLGFDKKIKKDWLNILFMYVEGHILTFTMYNYSFFGPTFQDQYRPITYYSQVPLISRESGNNRNSFYSGHTASCAYATFFMVKVYCDYNPNIGGTKYLFYTLATLPPLFIGYCRVMSLNHFPSDCMVGLAIGATMGIIVPELHKNRNPNITFGVYAPPGAAGISCMITIPQTKNKLTF